MKTLHALLCGAAAVAGLSATPVFAQASAEPVVEATVETTTLVGRVVMPEEVPEGVDVEGLSLDDAVVMLEGNYARPRMP